MSTFEMKNLAGDRVLVTGTDDAGSACSTVLAPTMLRQVQQEKKIDEASDAYDAAVEAFFAPLTEAAERADAAFKAPATLDPAYIFVVSEGVEGVEAEAPHVHTLDQDSAVVRLLEEGQTDRLIWVKTPAADVIEILAGIQGELDFGDAGISIQEVEGLAIEAFDPEAE